MILFYSGLYPLFRSGASDLRGAYIHVQVALNLTSDDVSDHEVRLLCTFLILVSLFNKPNVTLIIVYMSLVIIKHLITNLSILL